MEYFSTSEVAKLLSVNTTTIINWMDQGKLKGFKTLGGHRRILKTDFFTFLETHNFPWLKGLTDTKKCVLIVDDSELDRHVFRHILGKISKEIEIHEAIDGYAAGKKVAQVKPSLIILDLQLPGMDGFHVCREIRQDPELGHVKILAVSGEMTEANKTKIEQAGADAAFDKSHSKTDLPSVIKCLLFPVGLPGEMKEPLEVINGEGSLIKGGT